MTQATKLINFLEGIELEAEHYEQGHNNVIGVVRPNDQTEWQQDSNHYVVTLTSDYGSISTSFFGGSAITIERVCDDGVLAVLESLLMDARSVAGVETFYDWLDDNLHEPITNGKGLKEYVNIHEQCLSIESRLRVLLGEHYEDVLNIHDLQRWVQDGGE